jgi:hypothetical protein
MAPNKYDPHILVLPEDDANRQIANGFILHQGLIPRAIQVLPVAGGWGHVVDKFMSDYVPTMRQYEHRCVVMLIDFDGHYEQRFNRVKNDIPGDLNDRVFVLGVLSCPEELRRNSRRTFEEIGKALSQDCVDDTRVMWGHDLLGHNEIELERMISSVKPFLFH